MTRNRASLVLAVAASVGAPGAHAQDASPLLERMAGTWDVQQRMWPAPGAAAVELPRAVAQRRLWGGKYLEESMEPAATEAPPSAAFHRHALLSYNPVAKRYEYTSLDTRAPQLMTEIGAPLPSSDPAGPVGLQGGRFLAPDWGGSKNVSFRYRLTIGPVQPDGKQTVQLHLTPETVLPKKEFLAFEYVYSKRP
ncbi:MAG: DUF1579 family protein [Burkholderiales bacterium]|nr:DUF1579 family protein [Burkholderiales bacterium]